MPNIRRIYYSIIFIQIILTTYILINQDSNETLDTNQDYIRENENDQTLLIQKMEIVSKKILKVWIISTQF